MPLYFVPSQEKDGHISPCAFYLPLRCRPVTNTFNVRGSWLQYGERLVAANIIISIRPTLLRKANGNDGLVAASRRSRVHWRKWMQCWHFKYLARRVSVLNCCANKGASVSQNFSFHLRCASSFKLNMFTSYTTDNYPSFYAQLILWWIFDS